MAATIIRLRSESLSRVEDYLNDKFQNVSDLENIDNLLAKLHEQQTLLKQQLEEARQAQKQVDDDYDQEKTILKDRALKHQKDQADLTRTIQILIQSEVSDDAIRKLDEPMQKLRNIEIAEEYVRTLQHAEGLNHQVENNLESNPEDAVQSCQALQNLVRQMEVAQTAAEGAAPHLLDQLRSASQETYQNLKAQLTSKLSKVLDQMKWPKKELALAQSTVDEWSRYTKLLLRLQEPSLLKDDLDILSQTPTDPVVLLPLAVMVDPLAQRFRHHFYGDIGTNRLDKPEYFFRYTLEQLEDSNVFMTDYLQPLLDGRIQQDDRLDLVYTDAISSFITALLPMVTAKCLSAVPHLKSQPQLFSHFVHEMMAFDTTLQQSWAYAPFPGPLSDWKGLTWDILTKHGYFDSWLKLEKDFALQRYEKILENPNSRAIDYDGVADSRTKPTKGAIRINDLLESITERYRHLSSFSQKMKFLMDIQLSIFDRYHGYLFEHFRDYQVNSHTAGRALTGAVSASEALGLQGLESLAKIFGSAEFLERKMTDWSDDVFFLELWEELQDRASQHTGVSGSVGRGLTVEEVAAKTSATIRNADEILESDGGALFDETAASYRKLRESSEAEIVRALQVNVRNSLRPFQNVSIWASLSTTVTDVSQMAPSSALDSFNQTVAPLLQFLAKVLAPGSLRRVLRQICHTVQEELYDRLLMKHNFSAAGANQLKRDLVSISSTIDSSTGLQGEAQRHFVRLSDAIALISLPIKSSRSAASQGGEDDWGFGDDEDEAGNPDTDDLEFEEGHWGLWQAEKAIFADNASARKALQSMGLIELSESDARNIIKRRIEVNS